MDQATLKELLHYDPDTGVFTRNTSRGGFDIGSKAGVVHANGYRYIRINRKLFFAHRLAFLYMEGAWPEQHVDHINGNRLDNRWRNLRDVDTTTNNQNERKARSNNRSGFLGVIRLRSKWKAQIHSNGKKRSIGYFDTPEEAHEAYLEAKRQLHEGCTI